MVHELQSCTSKGATVQSRYRWSYKSIKTFLKESESDIVCSLLNTKKHFSKFLPENTKTRAIQKMINSEKMEVELGNLKISLTSIGGMICWSIFFNVSCNASTFMHFQEIDPENSREKWFFAFQKVFRHWRFKIKPSY